MQHKRNLLETSLWNRYTFLLFKHRDDIKFLFLFSLFLIPATANAASGNPIEEGLDWLVELLTSGLARSAAILAIAVLGYMAFAGKLTAQAAIYCIIGIVFIFGGATIVDLISARVKS